jgi:methylated-DNA-[protein]-cysteine S-methyltransferase
MYRSPVGWLEIDVDGTAVTAIRFTDSGIKDKPTNELLKKVHSELDEYFEGKRTQFSVPLKPEGTLFQLKVWRAMQRIESGKTAPYAAIAKQIGHGKAVRAVGASCGKNPIVVMIPCHRVTATGGIGGFSGGLQKKRWLLEHETKK